MLLRFSPLLGIVLLVGCGSSVPTFPVQGKLTKDGTAYKYIPAPNSPPGVGGGLRLGFRDLKVGGDVAYAILNNDDGTFTVSGNKGKGVPAGKYRVFIEMPPAMGELPSGVAPPTAPGGKVIAPAGKGGHPLDRDNSKLEVEIPGEGDVLVEIGKSPSVKRQ